MNCLSSRAIFLQSRQIFHIHATQTAKKLHIHNLTHLKKQYSHFMTSSQVHTLSRAPSSALLMVASLCSSATSSTRLRNLLATSTQSGIADLLSRSASTLGLAMSPSLEVSWATLSGSVVVGLYQYQQRTTSCHKIRSGTKEPHLKGTCCKHGSMTRHCTPAPLTGSCAQQVLRSI